MMQSQAQIHWKDYYEILGFTRENFDPSQVQARYRKVAREKHPDIVGKTPENTRAFQDLNEAYEVLKEEKLRKEYEKLYDQKVKEQQEEKVKGEQVKSRPTETKKRTTPSEPKEGSADWGFRDFRKRNRFEEIFDRVDFSIREAVKRVDSIFEGSGLTPLGDIVSELPPLDEMLDPAIYQQRTDAARKKWEEEQRKLNEQSRRLSEEREAKYQQEREEEKRKGQERRLKEDGEKQRKKQEAKDNFLSQELELTEADQYLLSAMTKLLRDKKNGGNLSEIQVRDALGNIIWEVGVAEKSSRVYDHLRFEIRRRLTDFLEEGKVVMLSRSDWSKVEVKEGTTFTMQEILDSYYTGVNPPHGFRDQMRNLGLLAEVLANDEGYDNLEKGEAVAKIKKYAVEEKAILGETKKMRVGDIEDGLREDRFREIPQVHEGMVSRA